MDYQCEGCGKFYDMNTYGHGSTCDSCGGKIELVENTYSVYRKVKVGDAIHVTSEGRNISKVEAEELKNRIIERHLKDLKRKLEEELYIQED